MSDSAKYVRAMMAEVDANNWLTRECLQLLAKNGSIRELQTEQGVIRGKTFLPCLRQVYLLRHAPFVSRSLDERVVADLDSTGRYNKIKLRHYYQSHGGNRLPQPFLRTFLSEVLEISPSSVENVLKTLTAIEMVQAVPCEIEPKAKAIMVNENFLIILEHWTKMKLEGF